MEVIERNYNKQVVLIYGGRFYTNYKSDSIKLIESKILKLIKKNIKTKNNVRKCFI